MRSALERTSTEVGRQTVHVGAAPNRSRRSPAAAGRAPAASRSCRASPRARRSGLASPSRGLVACECHRAARPRRRRGRTGWPPRATSRLRYAFAYPHTWSSRVEQPSGRGPLGRVLRPHSTDPTARHCLADAPRRVAGVCRGCGACDRWARSTRPCRVRGSWATAAHPDRPASRRRRLGGSALALSGKVRADITKLATVGDHVVHHAEALADAVLRPSQSARLDADRHGRRCAASRSATRPRRAAHLWPGGPGRPRRRPVGWMSPSSRAPPIPHDVVGRRPPDEIRRAAPQYLTVQRHRRSRRSSIETAASPGDEHGDEVGIAHRRRARRRPVRRASRRRSAKPSRPRSRRPQWCGHDDPPGREADRRSGRGCVPPCDVLVGVGRQVPRAAYDVPRRPEGGRGRPSTRRCGNTTRRVCTTSYCGLVTSASIASRPWRETAPNSRACEVPCFGLPRRNGVWSRPSTRHRVVRGGALEPAPPRRIRRRCSVRGRRPARARRRRARPTAGRSGRARRRRSVRSRST